ncbi:MAG: DUF3289 family protein [Treponema sp.]|nr:DUF3289 family protein [Treponema sp.]
MAEQIDTVETDLAEQQERDQIGTWDYSKRLLVKCESDGGYKEKEKPSKNALNIYKVMVWLEKKNGHIIKNHAIKRHSRIVVPKELKDFILIIGEEEPIDSECKQTQVEYEINYGDCVIFQHKQQPGLDKEASSKIISKLLENNQIYSSEKLLEYVKEYIDKETIDITAEDIKSGDLTAEKIVEKYSDLESTLHDYLELKEKTLESDDKSIAQQKELVKIIKEAKKNMENLLNLSSRGKWQKLATILYNKFCSGDNSDFIGEANDKDDENKANNYLMYKLFTDHNKTKDCIKEFKKKFKIYIKKYSYDIVSFNIKEFHDSVYNKEEGISRPIFNYGKLNFIGLTKGDVICFHDTQGFNVEAKEIKMNRGKFSCKLLFDFYDHFGLDLQDIENHGETGFTAWYLLQHLNENYKTGCNAFVNHIKHEEVVEIEIE